MAGIISLLAERGEGQRGTAGSTDQKIVPAMAGQWFGWSSISCARGKHQPHVTSRWVGLAYFQGAGSLGSATPRAGMETKENTTTSQRVMKKPLMNHLRSDTCEHRPHVTASLVKHV